MTRLTRAELVDLVRRLVESLGDGGLSRATVIEAERALKAEDATLPVDHEADAMFDALQPSLGTPVAPERRIRRQADVDAAFARGAESMRAAAVAVASKRANLQRFTDSDCAWGRSAECIRDELRHLPVPEDKS